MNKFLVKLLNAIIIIIIAPVLIVGFIPFAIFRGLQMNLQWTNTSIFGVRF